MNVEQIHHRTNAGAGPAQCFDDTLSAQLRPFFSGQEIVELTASISIQKILSKFNAALRISAQGFSKFPTVMLQPPPRRHLIEFS